jgi:REP element-mobilizing transposase RayT
MSHTYSKLLTHVTFSTKDRAPIIPPLLQPKLFAYMGGIVRDVGGSALEIGGMPDHVHLLILTPPKLALSDLMREVKAGSSRWMSTQTETMGRFSWQTGFGAFSNSQKEVPFVRAYIQNQGEHHRKKTFKEELLGLLEAYQVEYDERYLWD